MVPTLHIYLLGNFKLISGETAVNVDVPRIQSLLAYLALHHDTPQSRSQLAYLFWPDTTDAQAHSNLRTLVHRLRQALPNADAFLQVERQHLQWKPQHAEVSWTLDVLDFEHALLQAEQAVALYRGDLLLSCYEEWIFPEHDRLRQAFLRALERLIDLLQQERNDEEAIRVAQRLLRHDPLHEPTYRQLMRLYTAKGNRATALRVYHSCASLLERELGTEPNRATRQVYERLLHAEERIDMPVAPQLPLVAGTPLIGRKPEWAQLQAAWRDAPTRGAHMIVLSGEAGIGKTRLAEELLSWVDRQGTENMAAAIARCYVAEGELAYAPVAAWLRMAAWLRSDALRASLSRLADTWLTEVARLVPDLLVDRPDLPHPGPLAEGWQRERLFEALAKAILRTETSSSPNAQPLLLLLDDLQWCDHETLEWLHYLFRFDPRAPLLLVGTLRQEEIVPGHPLRALSMALQRNKQVTEIPLGELGESETTALAAQVAGHQLDPSAAVALYKETEGNPLFVVETVRAGLFKQPSGNGIAIQHGSKLPPTVQAVINVRLEQLSPQAQETARVASVIGRAFTFAVLAQASNVDEDALVLALDELWQRRIVREQGALAQDAYDFSHDKLREAAYTTLSTTRRRLLHRHVAHVLERVHADALDRVSGQIAAHYEQAGLPEQAIVYYQRAGKLAQQTYANAEAIAAFQRALALLETAPLAASQHEWRRERIAHLHELVGDILALTGQHDAARDAYQRALEQVRDCIEQARLYCKIGNTWETQRKNEAALHAYKMAESILGQKPAEAALEWWQQWIEIQRNRLQVHYWLAQTDEMMGLIEQTQPAVEHYGTPAQRAAFFQCLYLMSIRSNQYLVSEEALTYAQTALVASQEGDALIETAWAHVDLGGAHLTRGQFDEAEEHLQAALAVGEQTGNLMLQAMCLTFLSLVWRKRGQVGTVRDNIVRAEAVANKTQNAEFLGMVKANRAWLAWREGKLTEVQANGNRALALWWQTPVVYALRWAALWPLIGVALAQNRLPEAIDHARVLLSPEQQRLPDALTDLLEAAIQTWNAGQKDAAYAHLQKAAALAQTYAYL